MMTRQVEIVLKLATLSRILVFGLQVLFNLIPDHHADAFNPIAKKYEGTIDQVIQALFGGFHKWDAKYFLFIAENGYTEERMFAFFPLFPITIRSFAAVLQKVLIPLSFNSCLLLSGAVFNLLFFVGAVRALYYLTLRIFGDEKFALLATFTYSFNPASIFFSANYTESLYAFCVFQGLLSIENGSFTKSTVFFICASATRSNGIVNAGFPIYFLMQMMIKSYLQEKKIIFQLVLCLSRVIIITFLIFLPFVLFNIAGYMQFCINNEYIKHGTWCHDYVPLIYRHIQSVHWDLGFLKYYKFRKIPNIGLALPCVFLTFYGVFQYLSGFLRLVFVRRQHSHSRDPPLLASKAIFVYVVHVSFLSSFALLFMHVEVLTRFLFSSSPFPSWVTASVLMRDLDMNISEVYNAPFRTFSIICDKLRMKSTLLCVYYVSYFIIGIMLHVNFLPWT